MRLKLFSWIFAVFGLLCLIQAGYLLKQRNSILSFPVPMANDVVVDGEVAPLVLEIPDVEIKVPVSTAQIQNGLWEYSEEGISYLRDTPLPGEQGNSILYGHNWPNLLGSLNKVEVGDKIRVKFSDYTEKDFEVKYRYVVTPDQTHVLNPSEDSRITLYTCTGFLDSKRLVVVATTSTPGLTANP